jgi:hypothetical protein
MRKERRDKKERVLFYLVAVWESVRLEYSDPRLLLNAVRDGDNLGDSGKLFQRNALLNTRQSYLKLSRHLHSSS